MKNTFYNAKVGSAFYFIPDVNNVDVPRKVTMHTISRIENNGFNRSLYSADFFGGYVPFITEGISSLCAYYINNRNGWFGTEKQELLDYYKWKLNNQLKAEKEECADYIKRCNVRINRIEEALDIDE